MKNLTTNRHIVVAT